MTHNLGNKVNGSILLLLNSIKSDTHFCVMKLQGSCGDDCCPSPALRTWTSDESGRWGYNIWVLTWSCSSARHNNWRNCRQDFVLQVMGKGSRGPRGGTCWKQALTHSNAACRSALSDMGYSLISKPAHQIPTCLSRISLKKPNINCHYYMYSHNPQPGPPGFIP